MTEALVPTTAAIPQAKMRIWRALLRKPTSMFALLVLVLVSAIAVLAPWISPHDPTLVSIDDVLLAPSRTHLLGTDHAGRDMLSRVLSASLLSVGSGLIALATSVGLGVALGLVAGYYGGWFDAVSNWANSAVMALPAIVVLVAARAAFGPNLLPLMILLGIFISPVFFRLVYNAVRSVRKELYVDAARVAGLSDTRIIGRHVLTAVRAPVIVQTALVAGMSVAILAGVEFLGLGDPDSPSWGGLLNSGFQQTFNAPWLTIGPAVALGLTCMAFVLLGNALRDELERSSSPRRHRRGGAAAAAAAAVGASPVVGGPATDTGAVSHMGAERPGAGADALLAVRDLRVAYDQPDGSVVEIVHGVSLDLRDRKSVV